MNDEERNPPRWADAVLRSLVPERDRESISGDLLEEYRARRPASGALRANAWYLRQIAGIFWRLIRPAALTLGVLQIGFSFLIGKPAEGITVTLNRVFWYGSLVQAPGVSLLSASMYAWAGLHAARRTGLIRSGTLSAAATAVVGYVTIFGPIAAASPALLVVLLQKPFIFVILATLLAVPVGYAIVVGTAAAIVGRWLAPSERVTIRLS